MIRGHGFLEKQGWKFGKNEVKVLFTEETTHFTSFFTIFHHFGVPQGLIRVLHFPKMLQIVKNHDFAKFMKTRFSKYDFFLKMNVLASVYVKAKNLVSRIPIRNLAFYDTFF